MKKLIPAIGSLIEVLESRYHALHVGRRGIITGIKDSGYAVTFSTQDGTETYYMEISQFIVIL